MDKRGLFWFAPRTENSTRPFFKIHLTSKRVNASYEVTTVVSREEMDFLNETDFPMPNLFANLDPYFIQWVIAVALIIIVASVLFVCVAGTAILLRRKLFSRNTIKETLDNNGQELTRYEGLDRRISTLSGHDYRILASGIDIQCDITEGDYLTAVGVTDGGGYLSAVQAVSSDQVPEYTNQVAIDTPTDATLFKSNQPEYANRVQNRKRSEVGFEIMYENNEAAIIPEDVYLSIHEDNQPAEYDTIPDELVQSKVRQSCDSYATIEGSIEVSGPYAIIGCVGTDNNKQTPDYLELH
ncbi:hypothetical protein CAPTEDRAFT_190369 [Capitella teleta]|uniref:Uncharacterized protein n=1 Tax=Capitella teleta TaxID=283909 RepID=R7TIS8_CAPTE|nr:hypothetical protein CAPTEDRAFT_190369 [Capitella teleta]|eukprot:ELT91446.1 hypothetical protein CAPTEDRAFT_190369 [Capitella teleta]